MKYLISALAAIFMVGSAHATSVVNADATGPDTNNTAGFWGVSFTSDDGRFLNQLVFDITGDLGAFFDFDGDASFGTTPAFVDLVGIMASDISFLLESPVGGDSSHPARLILNFAAGTFGDGDSLRFGMDTDFLVSDPVTGGQIGLSELVLTAVLSDSASGSSSYSTVSDLSSIAQIRFLDGGDPVPLPAALPLFGAGLAAFGVMRRRRKAA